MPETIGHIETRAVSIEDDMVRAPWRHSFVDLERAEKTIEENRTRMTVQRTDELNRDQSNRLWSTLARVFGLKEHDAGIGDPIMLQGAEVRMARLREDIVQVTIPVTVTLFREDAEAFIAAVEEAAR